MTNGTIMRVCVFIGSETLLGLLSGVPSLSTLMSWISCFLSHKEHIWIRENLTNLFFLSGIFLIQYNLLIADRPQSKLFSFYKRLAALWPLFCLALKVCFLVSTGAHSQNPSRVLSIWPLLCQLDWTFAHFQAHSLLCFYTCIHMISLCQTTIHQPKSFHPSHFISISTSLEKKSLQMQILCPSSVFL